MYPYKIITFPDGSGITLYEIFILIGVIAALVLFRILAQSCRILSLSAPSYLLSRGTAVLYCFRPFTTHSPRGNLF